MSTLVEPKLQPVQQLSMESELAQFKNPQLAKKELEVIRYYAPPEAVLMEVCGTHTVSIARNGIRDLMPKGIRLASGPGCPVCVTARYRGNAYPRSDHCNLWRYDACTRLNVKFVEGTSERQVGAHCVFAA